MAGSSARFSYPDHAEPKAGIPMAFTLPTVPRPADGPLCRFLAMGDWGFDPSEGGAVLIKNLAANMAACTWRQLLRFGRVICRVRDQAGRS